MQFLKMLQLAGVVAVTMSLTTLGLAQPVDDARTLPAARPGECYAKVVVPAKYKTEPVDVTTRQAANRYEVLPGEFETVQQRALVKESAVKLVPVPAEFDVTEEEVQLAPASQQWVVGRAKNALPASPMLLAAIENTGISLAEQSAGTCLSEYYVPAQFETEQVRVLKTEGYEQVEVDPPVYEWVTEKVVVQEASKEIVEVPAEFETVTEKLLIAPASQVWKPGTGLIQKVDNTTGEIMCLVEVPAKYKTVKRKVIKSEAATKVVDVPAQFAERRVRKLVKPSQERRIKVEPEYESLEKLVKVADERFFWRRDGAGGDTGAEPTGNIVCLMATPAKVATVEQRKVKTPASVRETEIPAEYETISVRKVATEPATKEINIPSVVKTLSTQVKVSEERLVWRSVLCETNMTRRVITDLQNALKTAGFDPGPVDGQVGAKTLRAIDDYQRANGMERGGLTMTTLEALGVRI